MSLDPTLPEVRAGAASPTFGSLRDELRERAPRGGRVAPWRGLGGSPVMLHRPPPLPPGAQPGAPELEDLSAPRTPRERRTRLCCRAPGLGRDPQLEGLSWQEATLSSRPGWRGTHGCRPPGTRAPRSRAAQDETEWGPGGVRGKALSASLAPSSGT
ncbi:uncharacterized protein LOC131816338 isoform X1 [Mustela lutreola]|uniref:uncharacterized protein LOC131816338 isoform X1 n=1 Tax=Mustela lutreola TaxID=9666 RepID=UPI002797BC1E|nr:uncharacterized protein LOC131816338 isoform X1 [Mustela lutreola]